MVNRVVNQGPANKPIYYRYLYLKAKEDAYIQFISSDTSTGSDIFVCHVHHTTEINQHTGKARYPIYLCFPRSMSAQFIAGNSFLERYPESKEPCQF